MSNADYKEYINSPAWFEVREKAFNFHGRECKKCKSSSNLHVHHKTYKNFKNENIEVDLIPLCRRCHKKLHKLQRRKELNVWAATEFFIDNIRPPKQKKHRKKRPRERFYKVFPHHTELHKSYEQKVKVKEPGRVDLKKFMEMYGLDEATAISLLPQ